MGFISFTPPPSFLRHHPPPLTFPFPPPNLRTSFLLIPFAHHRTSMAIKHHLSTIPFSHLSDFNTLPLTYPTQTIPAASEVSLSDMNF
ncbi:hypothetical protein LguiA_013862 [Lonicera macranthoides]